MSSVRWPAGRNEDRIRAIDIGEEMLQVLDFRQVVVHDVGMAGVSRQEVLMVILSRIEFPIRLDLGNDRRIEDARLVELGDIGLGDPRLLGASLVGKIAERYWVPLSGP
jgi:hypothetical protein